MSENFQFEERHFEALAKMAANLLAPHQKDWFNQIMVPNNTPHGGNLPFRKRMMILACRRAGKGFTAALGALGLAMITGKGVVIFSLRIELARNLMREFYTHVTVMEELLGESITTTRNVDSCLMKNGAYIQVIPGDLKKFRGNGSHVIIDELGANKQDAHDIIKAATYVTLKPNWLKLIVLTNATGPGTWLQDFIEGKRFEIQRMRKSWYVSNVNYETLLKQGYFTKEQIEETRLQSTESDFRREMGNEFIESEAQGFTLEQITKCFLPNLPEHANKILSIDVGFANNPTGYLYVARDSDKYYAYSGGKIYSPNKESALNEQLEFFNKEIEIHKPYRIVVDQGTQGYALLAALRGRWGERIVASGINEKILTTTWQIVREGINNERLYFNSPDLRDHLCDTKDDGGKCIRTRRMYVAGREDHADMVDALLMAIKWFEDHGQNLPAPSVSVPRRGVAQISTGMRKQNNNNIYRTR